MKNKEWLKEQLSYLQDGVGESFNDYSKGLNAAYNTLEILINELDEPDQDINVAYDLLAKITTLSQEDFDLYWNCINDGVVIRDLKQEKVVIPQFVADWIEKNKEHLTIYGALDVAAIDTGNLGDWVQKDDMETLSRAWLDGYEVEKWKLYRVMLIKDKYLIYNRKNKQLHNQELDAYVGDYEQMEFTEQEIKKIDERYWAFAEESAK